MDKIDTDHLIAHAEEEFRIFERMSANTGRKVLDLLKELNKKEGLLGYLSEISEIPKSILQAERHKDYRNPLLISFDAKETLSKKRYKELKSFISKGTITKREPYTYKKHCKALNKVVSFFSSANETNPTGEREIKKQIKKYKLRAGCLGDIINSIPKLQVLSFSSVYDRLNPELEFSTHLSLDEIRDKLKKIEDGHIMLQTVQLADNYTGERIMN